MAWACPASASALTSRWALHVCLERLFRLAFSRLSPLSGCVPLEFMLLSSWRRGGIVDLVLHTPLVAFMGCRKEFWLCCDVGTLYFVMGCRCQVVSPAVVWELCTSCWLAFGFAAFHSFVHVLCNFTWEFVFCSMCNAEYIFCFRRRSGRRQSCIIPGGSARVFCFSCRFLKLPVVLDCPEYVRFARMLADSSSMGMRCSVHFLSVPVDGVSLSGAGLPLGWPCMCVLCECFVLTFLVCWLFLVFPSSVRCSFGDGAFGVVAGCFAFVFHHPRALQVMHFVMG